MASFEEIVNYQSASGVQDLRNGILFAGMDGERYIGQQSDTQYAHHIIKLHALVSSATFYLERSSTPEKNIIGRAAVYYHDESEEHIYVYDDGAVEREDIDKAGRTIGREMLDDAKATRLFIFLGNLVSGDESNLVTFRENAS